jgi:hypothetical protein
MPARVGGARLDGDQVGFRDDAQQAPIGVDDGQHAETAPDQSRGDVLDRPVRRRHGHVRRHDLSDAHGVSFRPNGVNPA